MRRTSLCVWILFTSTAVACGGPAVTSDSVAVLPPRPDDSSVHLFVRSERIPGCPWEVIGTVESEPGWVDDAAEREAVEREVRAMGGQAVLLEVRTDARGEVIRFLDPASLCDPLAPPEDPDG